MIVEDLKQALRMTQELNDKIKNAEGWDVSYGTASRRTAIDVPETKSYPYYNGEPLGMGMYTIRHLSKFLRYPKLFSKALVSIERRPIPVTIHPHRVVFGVERRVVKSAVGQIKNNLHRELEFPRIETKLHISLHTELDAPSRPNFWYLSGYSIHPHAPCRETMCLGDFGPLIEEVLSADGGIDRSMLYDIWMTFLGRFEVTDVAGVFGLTWIEEDVKTFATPREAIENILSREDDKEMVMNSIPILRLEEWTQ